MIKAQGKPDFMMALAVLALVTTGLMLILSASSILAFNRYADSLYFVKRQILFGLVGVTAMAWMQGRSCGFERICSGACPVGGYCAIFLLLLVLVPGIGKVGGARRWLGARPFPLPALGASQDRPGPLRGRPPGQACIEQGRPGRKAGVPVAMLAAGACSLRPDLAGARLRIHRADGADGGGHALLRRAGAQALRGAGGPGPPLRRLHGAALALPPAPGDGLLGSVEGRQWGRLPDRALDDGLRHGRALWHRVG